MNLREPGAILLVSCYELGHQPLVALAEALEARHGRNGHAPPVDVEGVSQRGAPARPFLRRLPFAPPSRQTLPPLHKYAWLEHRGQRRTVGYVEASRGCLHLCTH